MFGNSFPNNRLVSYSISLNLHPSYGLRVNCACNTAQNGSSDQNSSNQINIKACRTWDIMMIIWILSISADLCFAIWSPDCISTWNEQRRDNYVYLLHKNKWSMLGDYWISKQVFWNKVKSMSRQTRPPLLSSCSLLGSKADHEYVQSYIKHFRKYMFYWIFRALAQVTNRLHYTK